jgi:hypothetical protein
MFFGSGRTYTNGKPILSATMPIPIAPVATPAITSGLPNCFSIFSKSHPNFLLLEMRINLVHNK